MRVQSRGDPHSDSTLDPLRPRVYYPKRPTFSIMISDQHGWKRFETVHNHEVKFEVDF